MKFWTEKLHFFNYSVFSSVSFTDSHPSVLWWCWFWATRRLSGLYNVIFQQLSAYTFTFEDLAEPGVSEKICW